MRAVAPMLLNGTVSPSAPIIAGLSVTRWDFTVFSHIHRTGMYHGLVLQAAITAELTDMKSGLSKLEKYPIITPKRMASAENAGRVFVSAYAFVALYWLIFSSLVNFGFLMQVAVLGCWSFVLFFKYASTAGIIRSVIDLKAKGLDIKDRFMIAVMPWDWLVQVEIRQRNFSLIPNYVYFQFKNSTDVLILWDDVKETMDSTTLISCVRTWAPHAEIRGDAKLTKSESIATYTELWLSEMSLTKSAKRLRQDQTLPAETVLSNSYKIDRILSGGGQGTAYLASVLPEALLPNMPSQIVIKEFILPENERGLKKATDSLVKEVAILRRINHPLIVRLYDFFIEDMRGYLAIEFVDGVTLRQLVTESGPRPEEEVVKVAIALCKALSYLHELSPPIIHGDVTPDNIMVQKDGEIRLMDFDASQELTRNKTNTVVGKHSYMSPEQFKGMLGETSDIYALGCSLYFLLTGVDPEPITESRPMEKRKSVSSHMNEIVAKATKFDESERFATLNEVRAQLERV